MAFIRIKTIDLKSEDKKRYDGTYESFIVEIEESDNLMINTEWITMIRKYETNFFDKNAKTPKKIPFCYYDIVLARGAASVEEAEAKKIFDAIGTLPF